MGSAWALALAVAAALVFAVVVFLFRHRRLRRLRYRRRSKPSAVPAMPVGPIADEPAPGRRKPEWVRAEVLRLKAVIGEIGVLKLSQVFNRIHGERMTVGKTFVHELLKRQAYEVTCLRRDLRNAPAKPYRINAVWALDFTFQSDAMGNTHAVLGLIDHGSRVLLRLRRLTNRTAWTVLGHLCLAIGEFGKPRALRTDNEAVFRSRLLRLALKVLGIRRQFTQRHCPWQNGRIERLFGTLKPVLKSLLGKCALPDAAALDRALLAFGRFYNHVRPHQNLGGRTPAEVWQAGSASAPPKPVREPPMLVSLLDGLLVGYYLRR